MKHLLVFAVALIVSLTSNGQAKQVVNKTAVTSTSNPIKLLLSVDKYSDERFLFSNFNLVISRDNKKGFKITPSFTEVNGKWKYDGMIVKSYLSRGCNEDDMIYFLFDDGTKVSYKSWQEFNCDNTSYFDESQNINPLKKRLKGVKFVNGRTFESYEMMLTNPDDKNYFINLSKALDSYNKQSN
jgi:hypothetical protein